MSFQLNIYLQCKLHCYNSTINFKLMLAHNIYSKTTARAHMLFALIYAFYSKMLNAECFKIYYKVCNPYFVLKKEHKGHTSTMTGS